VEKTLSGESKEGCGISPGREIRAHGETFHSSYCTRPSQGEHRINPHREPTARLECKGMDHRKRERL
jgi:hypothetical protein